MWKIFNKTCRWHSCPQQCPKPRAPQHSTSWPQIWRKKTRKHCDIIFLARPREFCQCLIWWGKAPFLVLWDGAGSAGLLRVAIHLHCNTFVANSEKGRLSILTRFGFNKSSCCILWMRSLGGFMFHMQSFLFKACKFPEKRMVIAQHIIELILPTVVLHLCM